MLGILCCILWTCSSGIWLLVNQRNGAGGDWYDWVPLKKLTQRRLMKLTHTVCQFFEPLHLFHFILPNHHLIALYTSESYLTVTVHHSDFHFPPSLVSSLIVISICSNFWALFVKPTSVVHLFFLFPTANGSWYLNIDTFLIWTCL